jgi:hypothetical protein
MYPLPIGSPVTVNTTVNSTWAYFQTSFHGSSVSELVVTVAFNTQLPDQAGLFAAYNYIPSYTQYDFSGHVSNVTIQLIVEIPRTGDWFFAVRGANVTLTITANVQTLCPNNCSMHGVCQSSGLCSCFDNWGLYNDCSQESSQLLIGGSVTDQTVHHMFNYYQLVLNSDATLTIQVTVNRGQKKSELDGTASYSLFVGVNYAPTLNTYDYVSRTVGMDNHVVRIEKPPVTTLMIGVWGHDVYNYTLTVYNNVTCPNRCNGNGVCLDSGICKCNANWGQEDCSLYRQSITPGSTISGGVLSKGKKYYSVVVTDFPKTVEFDFNVNTDSIGLNPNIVIVYQYDQLPHLLRYAQRVVCGVNCSLVVENAPMGNHVIGVINQGTNLVPLNYTLTAGVEVDCPNNCSLNGQCVQSACQCNKWYRGDDCSLYLEGLGFDPSDVSTISNGQWRFYEFNVSASTFLVLYIQPATPQSGNVTLPNYRIYAQFGRLPSLNNYIKSTAAGLDYYQELLIEGSANIFPGTWYYGVYGLGSAISYTVTASFESYCPRNCSGHGVCGDNFQCICEPPYISDDCSSQDLPITTGVFTAGTISFDRWNYYHMNILGDDALEITVAESSEDHQLGLIWVFAKKNGRPTIEDNDYRNQSDTSLLTVWIPSTAARGNWTIGITGSPRNHGIFVERATYTLIALTGCETYTACSSCVADPNCGWCWNDLNDPNAGLCTAGDQHHSFTENCVIYQFDTCDVSVPQAAATFRGIILGIAVGLGGLLLLGGFTLFIWRRHRLRQKQKMRPTKLVQTYKQFQQGLFADPEDTDSFLSPGGQPPAPDNTNNVNAAFDISSRKYKKRKIKPTTRIAKYGSMLDDEGYSSLSNTIGVDVHTDDEDEESSSEGESIISSAPKD